MEGDSHTSDNNTKSFLPNTWDAMKNFGSNLGREIKNQGNNIREMLEQDSSADTKKPIIQDSLLLLIPLDIKKIIISKLDIRDVPKLEQTCSEFKNVFAQQDVWKRLFDKEKRNWNAFECSSKLNSGFKTNMMRFALRILKGEDNEESEDASLSWKQLFIQQYQLNQRSRQSSASSPSTKALNAINNFFKKVYRVPVFGDTNAKRLLYDIMYGNLTPFNMTQLYPGVEGIGSGFGYTINNHDLNLAAMYNFRAHEKSRPALWKEFFGKSSGFVFVIGPDHKTQLDEFVTDEAIPIDAPVLILCSTSTYERARLKNPDDEENAQGASFHPKGSSFVADSTHPIEIAEQFGLQSEAWKDRTWCVRKYDSLGDVMDGFWWLTTKM